MKSALSAWFRRLNSGTVPLLDSSLGSFKCLGPLDFLCSWATSTIISGCSFIICDCILRFQHLFLGASGWPLWTKAPQWLQRAFLKFSSGRVKCFQSGLVVRRDMAKLTDLNAVGNKIHVDIDLILLISCWWVAGLNIRHKSEIISSN